MSRKVDYSCAEERLNHFALLRSYLRELEGQPFLFLRFSYGDELNLHFGEEKPYRSKAMTGLVKGSHILSTRASKWHLSGLFGTRPLDFATPRGVRENERKEELERAGALLRGTQIKSVQAFRELPDGRHQSCLSVTFGLIPGAPLARVSYAKLTIEAPEEKKGSLAREAVPIWELLIPKGHLVMKSNGRWCFSPLDVRKRA